MRDSMVFYRSFYEAIKDLPADQFKESVRAIMDYALDDKQPETNGIEKTVYLLAKPQIDVNNKRYLNGTKGGRQKTKIKDSETEHEPNGNQIITKPEPNVNDNVNDNVNVKDKNTYTPQFEELWSVYPRKVEKSKAFKAYKARLQEGFSEDELLLAVKRYADSCAILSTEERYVKHASTFFSRDKPFADYLKPDYSPPSNPKPQNKFINFHQRDNTSVYEQLEARGI